VTITNKLSVSDHVRHVTVSCASVVHPLRVLRCHGMNDAALKTVYQAVVISNYCTPPVPGWGSPEQPTVNAQMLSSVVDLALSSVMSTYLLCHIMSRTLTMRCSSGLWETNIMFCTIFFLIVKLD